jgi:hypothetical protein
MTRLCSSCGPVSAVPFSPSVERLLEEACPNHTYPIMHKLRNGDMMKNFMTSWSLTLGMEPKGDPGGKCATAFTREEVVMTVYDEHPPPGRLRIYNLSPRTPTHCVYGPRNGRDVRDKSC